MPIPILSDKSDILIKLVMTVRQRDRVPSRLVMHPTT